ncbi:MAG TPA: sigma-70 family RNA polymerase sigma factor [Planctomycetota bacterium]
MSSIPHPRPEDWLARVGWMRALARGLLADPGAADDVVQEACVAALEHPPLADRPLEPWLGRVVRNFAWKRRRGEGRRAAHERLAPTGEPVPGPAATAERLELQRSVLSAVEAVPEPFRTVVVERYLQGRTSADIARALGVPEGTVRWRLARGLEELRTRLDARHGGRDAWCALLAPLAVLPAQPVAPDPATVPEPGPLASIPTGTGVLAMLGATKLVLAAVVGVAAVGFVLLTRDGGERGARPDSDLAQAATLEEPVAAAPLGAVPDSAPAPREARATSPSASVPAPVPAEPAPAADARPTQGTLAMRFVDAQGAPWSGVEVFPRGGEAERRTSGPDGRVELAVKPYGDGGEWGVALLAQREGCATRLLRATATLGRTTDLGDVVLVPGSRLEGRVLDEQGLALEGATVGLAAVELPEGSGDGPPLDEGYLRRHGSEGFERERTVASGPDGTFELTGVPAGRHRLWAHAPSMRHGWTEPFEVRAGEDLFALELRLPALLATDRITGIVLDPSGEPLGGARLMSTYLHEHESGSTTSNVGDDGRFDLVLRRETRYSFVASDREGRYADAYAWDVTPGTRELELRLGEVRTFEALVRDEEGRPLEGCRFKTSMEVGGAMTSSDGRPQVREPGLYALVLPSIPFQLVVEADGYQPATFESLRPESVGARLEVVLTRAPRLAGRVVADGKPVAGARVTLHRAVVADSYWRDGFYCLYRPEAADQATSDADGRFTLTCKQPGPVWVRATSAGWTAADLGPLQPDAAGELRIELTGGGSIEGRVLLPDGADAEGVVVGISRGDGHPRTLRAGPEGRFRFDHLVPGRWQVQRCESELDPSTVTTMSDSTPVEIEWSCTVEPGRVTRFDLDLTR